MIKTLKYHLVALVIIQLALCFLYGYHKVYDKRPFSIHQWRQTDCASFTKNYYEEGMHFFKPEIHWQGNMQGKTVSEFPLINYTVACLWKVFGEHEYLYRFTVFTIYIIALLFLFVMVYSTSGSLVYSYFATTIITTSPVLAYYSFNFLADVPAFSFAIMSISLFFIFLKNKDQKLFVLSVLLATLAVLLKASSATVLAIIGLISIVGLLGFSERLSVTGKLFNTMLLPLISFLGSGIIICSWYYFAYTYNNENSNGVFLMETLPVWDLNNEEVTDISRSLFNEQLAVCFNKGVWFLLTIVFGWLLLNIKKLPGYLQIAFIVSMLSFIAFIILFFQVFNFHDYYLINVLILPVIILVCFGAYLKTMHVNVFNKKLIVLCSCIFFFNAAYCSSIVRLRNCGEDSLNKMYPFISSQQKDFFNYLHEEYSKTLQPIETVTPYLRSLGIKRADKVISIPDPSFNISLYLMDQKGFTATRESLQADSTRINQYKGLGAEYVVLNDTHLLRTTCLAHVNMQEIGQYKNVFIYKLN